MWKLSMEFEFKRNIKKQQVLFVPFPTIGFITGLHNHKTEYTIGFLWLFLSVNTTLKFVKKQK